MDDAGSRKTYRYLRVSIVAMALLLATSLIIEIAWGDGEQFGSISGYYYSPVRTIFVGALVAIGPALIAIKGRVGWEDALLDLAGMVVPLVALVPTPRDLGEDVCGPGVARCVPPDLVPAVENNVTALVVLGAAGLTFAWWSAGRNRDRATSIALFVATGLWIAFGIWFWAGRDAFLSGAHYGSAILFFFLIAGVAYLNGRRVRERGELRLMSPKRYSGTYRTLSGLMVLTVVVAVVFFVLSGLMGFALWFFTIFAVEAVLLALFVTFWVLQTAENWDQEAAHR